RDCPRTGTVPATPVRLVTALGTVPCRDSPWRSVIGSATDGRHGQGAGPPARRPPRTDLGRAARRLRLADDDRPQADRAPLLLHGAGVLRRRGDRGAADAG